LRHHFSVLFARIGQFVATVARHAVPLGGIVGLEWHPVTAITVYWLESLLLALGVIALCALLKRRGWSDMRGAASRRGDEETVRAIDAELEALRVANLDPRSGVAVLIGGLGIVGGFLGGLMIIMVANRHIEEPVPWPEVGEAVAAMAIIVAVTFLFDLWSFGGMSVADVRARVDACLARWALLWILCFVGTIMLVWSGRPALFFGLFAVLKITFEVLGRLEKYLGPRFRPKAQNLPKIVTRLPD
jgi:hypothetical protein